MGSVVQSEEGKKLETNEVEGKVHSKLYHLLTDKKTLTIGSIVFLDYNAGIDCFLKK